MSTADLFFWHGAMVMVLVKGLCLVFLQWLIFGLNPKWACFTYSLLWNVKLFEVGVLLFTSSPIILSFSGFFTLDEHKKQDLPFFISTAVCWAWKLSCPWMWLRPNDWTVLLHISHCTLPISNVKSCSYGSCGGEKGLAQSSLATFCITRMQMSYEAIHLLEMPPWFQFESCLQSHCASPLLHVKEVSLCERSEGDNCT